MLSICRAAPTRVGSTATQFQVLEKMLQRIAGTLLEGNILNVCRAGASLLDAYAFFLLVLQNCLTQQFDYDIVNVTRNPALGKEMEINLTSYFAYLAARIGEANETDQRERFVSFCGLYVMFTRFYMPNVDKKFFKEVWAVAKKVGMNRNFFGSYPIVLIFFLLFAGASHPPVRQRRVPLFHLCLDVHGERHDPGRPPRQRVRPGVAGAAQEDGRDDRSVRVDSSCFPSTFRFS